METMFSMRVVLEPYKYEWNINDNPTLSSERAPPKDKTEIVKK
jgi:hypothetical protein